MNKQGLIHRPFISPEEFCHVDDQSRAHQTMMVFG
jgi:hypothetical protein